MVRWKSWKFGRAVQNLPVVRDAAQWARGTGSKVAHVASQAVRFPSRAVPETLQFLLTDPSRFLVKKRRAWDLVKYSRLYTGETYPVAETYSCVVHDAWVHVPSGFVITADKEVLGFSSYCLPALYEGHASTNFEDAPVVEKAAFKLCTAWGNNYAHWLMDALPKASALTAADERMVLLDKPSPAFQEESLALLGAGDVLRPETELLRFRELHFVSTGRSGVPHPSALIDVRDKLRQAAGVAGGPRRIYISRQQTRRRLSNGEEVSRILTSFGFEEIVVEELGFAEQVRLFEGAEAIFGAHGAGTMNVIFAPQGAALIEAINPCVWDHAAHRVASLCGVRHYHLFGENVSREFDMRLDPRTLERTLALALDASSRSRDLLLEELY